MPPKKKAAKKAAKTPEKSFEESLWDTATKLRNNMDTTDWSGATETTRQGSPEGERGGAHQHGVAGFVLANGSMSTNTKGEGAIRQKMVENDLVENDLVDCMIALPGQLFFTTQIPVCIWILRKSPGSDVALAASSTIPLKEMDGAGAPSLPGNRRGETLFIDARKIGSMISRTQKELTAEDIAQIAETYHAWRSGSNGAPAPLSDSKKDAAGATSLPDYQDTAGYCKSATLEDIRKHDFVLTPGRYVGAAALEDDGIPFETKMTEMSQTLYGQMDEAKELDQTITENLKSLGYGRP